MSQLIWELDPTHSQVGFGTKHMMFTTVRGRFTGLSGKIVVDRARPGRSSVEVEIDAVSVDTGLSDRDDHLRGEEFLHVEEHPTIEFRSTRVDGAATQPGDELRVTGDLTIRGVTREVDLEAIYTGRGTDPWGSERVGFQATTTIDRREWGLTWNQALETGGVLVGHEVQVELSVQAVEPREAVAGV